MSLKSIKKNYTTLLKAFSEAGVKINESQKESLDNFITDLEETMNEQRDQAIITTKKMVEEKLGKEYKTVVESILKHQAEHAELAGKVQNKVVKLNESKKIAEAVDSYLDSYIDEVLPKKNLVDYKRMQKLERIQESLKEMLSVSEGEIDKKAEEQKKELEKKNTELTDKLSECENKIEGSQKKIDELSEELDNFKSKEFIQSKIKNLPVVESKKILEKTKGMSFVELKKNYKSIFESVQEEVKKEQEVKEDDNGLEEAINDILEGKKSETSSKETSDKDVEGTESTPATDEENNEVITDECENTDSVVVTESQMQSWIETLNRITPKK